MIKFPWKEIFVINLDTDKERLENIKKQFDPLGLSVNKLSNRREEDWENAPASQMCRIYCEKSTIGAYYGHYKLWKKMVDENIESALIIEDDVTLDNQFLEKFQKYWANVPSDWDMVLLGCVMLCKREFTLTEKFSKLLVYTKSKTYPINDYINRVTSFTGIHAYILNLRTAKRFLEASSEIDNVIELQLSTYVSENTDLKVYSFEDYIITQNLILYESVNNTSRTPNIVNKIIDNIYVHNDDKYKISLGYIANMPFYQYRVSGYMLNVINFIFLLSGVLLGLFLNLQYAILISVVFILIDIFYTYQFLNTKINIENYFKLWLIIIIGIFIGFIIRKITLK